MDNDNDDCLYLPDGGLAGCAFHHWDDDRRWSFSLQTVGDCDGPGDAQLDATRARALVQDVANLLPVVANVCESTGKDETARVCRTLAAQARRLL